MNTAIEFAAGQIVTMDGQFSGTISRLDEGDQSTLPADSHALSGFDAWTHRLRALVLSTILHITVLSRLQSLHRTSNTADELEGGGWLFFDLHNLIQHNQRKAGEDCGHRYEYQ